MRSVKVRVPATTANLGPGYDCLGMALQIYNQIELVPEGRRPLTVEASGNLGEDSIALDETNLVARAASRIFALAGSKPDVLTIRIQIEAPLARGMGSSASAIVGGMMAANLLLGEPVNAKRLLFEMARMEGHPDNIVPAFAGGLSSSVMLEDQVVYQRVIPADNFSCVLLIPDFELSTAKARQALPRSVPIQDAVYNLSRVTQVYQCLASGDLETLSLVMDDRLHQPYRQSLIRGYEEVCAAATAAGAAAACISGAGPTLLAIAEDAVADRVAAHMEEAIKPLGISARPIVVKPDVEGAREVESDES